VVLPIAASHAIDVEDPMRTTSLFVVTALLATGSPLAAQAGKSDAKAATKAAPMKPSAATAAARTAVDAANARFVAAFNKGDIAGVVRNYASDAILLPPNAPMQRGHDAIAGFWKGGWDAGIRNIKLTTVDFGATGDYASEIGTYTLEIHPPGGAVMQDHGKYLVLWKKSASGEWQLFRDIWNTDVPEK